MRGAVNYTYNKGELSRIRPLEVAVNSSNLTSLLSFALPFSVCYLLSICIGIIIFIAMTTFVYHNLADNIRDFFSNKSVTREQCDEWVVSRTHEVVVPAENQGVFSYTVTAGPTLFQFREQDSTLDIRTLTLAKEIHPEFVAEAKYHGTFGDVDPLHIYEMDHLSGSVYPLAGIPEDDISRRGNTVKDLARSILIVHSLVSFDQKLIWS